MTMLKQLVNEAEMVDKAGFPGLIKKIMAIGKKNGVDFKDADGEAVKEALQDAYSQGYADGYNSAPKRK